MIHNGEKVGLKRCGFFYCSKGAENVIDWLKRTYEHLPKQQGETNRYMNVTAIEDKFLLMLSVGIGDDRVTASYKVTVIEYDDANWNIEAEIIDTLCARIKRELDERNELN